MILDIVLRRMPTDYKCKCSFSRNVQHSVSAATATVLAVKLAGTRLYSPGDQIEINHKKLDDPRSQLERESRLRDTDHQV